jgi:tetratricopeptide (TPR) repeat protein
VGALFFGLHPLRVESVAWITERRDVLAGLFYFATLLAFERMVTSRDAGSRGWGWQTACLAFFTLSLLAKAWAMMLPIVFVLLDVFPLRRVLVSRVLTRDSVPLLLEKLPFVVLAGGAALLALMGQREAAMGMVGDHGVVDRIVQAGYGSLFYVWKTVWPFGLSPLYILPDDFNPFGIHRLAPAALSGLLTVGLVVAARKWTWAAIVWLSYLIIVAPVLGFAQSGHQLAADRYTYFPCLPFAAVVAAGWLHSVRRGPRYLATVVIGTSVVLICLGSLTFRQTGFWRDEASLWARALEVDPHNYVALYNQGVVRSERGDLDGARGDLDSALRENPLYARAWFSRGNVRRDVGDVAGALADYAEALRLEPSMSQAYVNRANVLSHQGDLTGALADYNEALRLKPNNAKAYLNRAALRSRLGDDAGALADYEICLRLKPDWAVVYFNRGNHHLLHGRLKEAESQFGEAIRIEPSFSDYWYNRASVRQRLGDTAGMTSDLVEALRYAPDDWPQRPQVVKALGRKTGTGKAGTGVTR